MSGGTRFVELNHELADGMAPYPGLPAPRIGAHVDHAASRDRYDGGDEFFLGKVEMPGNVGTYVDSPFHRFADREDLAQVPLERLAGLPGFVVDVATGDTRAAAADLPDADLTGAAILLRTGWDRRWGSDAYWEPGPYVGEDLAARLVERGAGVVGVDFWNVDDTETRRRPVHTRLLDAGVLVVEHLCNLDRLPPNGFRFFAPVLRIRGGASFPVRAFAEVAP
ncbi:MAG TPA: cyclase family protein [Actinomycetota bacterium]|nr:cyclase family protein [Actinomycetota bacterium]